MSTQTDASEKCPQCGVIRAPLCEGGWCPTCGYNPSYEAKIKDMFDFLAATSLCEGCQKKRLERRIIATPRIQVEEERDRLRGDSALLDALLDPEGPFVVHRTMGSNECSVHTRDEIRAALGEGGGNEASYADLRADGGLPEAKALKYQFCAVHGHVECGECESVVAMQRAIEEKQDAE